MVEPHGTIPTTHPFQVELQIDHFQSIIDSLIYDGVVEAMSDAAAHAFLVRAGAFANSQPTDAHDCHWQGNPRHECRGRCEKPEAACRHASMLHDRLLHRARGVVG